jgi:hypothetical protein
VIAIANSGMICPTFVEIGVDDTSSIVPTGEGAS